MPVAKEQIRQIITENNISSVADVYALLKESFKDILQELLEAEMDASLGYEKNQKGPLNPVYPFVFMDCIHYKVREDDWILSRAAYVVLGITVDGHKDILSITAGANLHRLNAKFKNLFNGFRLTAGRPDNGFIRHKFRIPHGKAPPFLHAAFVRHCVCDAMPYSGSVRKVPRFPAVCNARKNKGK